MRRASRLLPRFELSVLVLFSLAPLALGCIKLKTLECESWPEGCQDQKPDAKRADAPVIPDGPVAQTDDAAPADAAASPDTHVVAPDGPRLPDTASDTKDGSLPDGASDLAIDRRDAAPAASEGGVPDTALPDTKDALLPDTAPRPDTRTPDLALMPDTSTSNTVTFSAGVAKGAMTGYGWVTMGALDIVSSPTCGPTNAPITSADSCVSTSTNWDTSNALCVSGTIPALPKNPTSTDYNDNWGIQLGVNASDPIGALGQSYSTITLNFTGTPQSGLRATVHRTGDPIGTTYCALVKSGEPLVLTNFNTSCWNTSGTYLTGADLPKIDKVSLQISSTQSEIPISKLCLTSIVFAK